MKVHSVQKRPQQRIQVSTKNELKGELEQEIKQESLEREKTRKMLREKLTPRENEIIILHVITRYFPHYDDSHSRVYAIMKSVRPLYVETVVNIRLEEIRCRPDGQIDCIEDVDRVLDELAEEYTIKEIYPKRL